MLTAPWALCAVITVVHVAVVIFIIIAGLTQANPVAAPIPRPMPMMDPIFAAVTSPTIACLKVAPFVSQRRHQPCALQR